MIEYCPICRCSHAQNRHLNLRNLNYTEKSNFGNRLKTTGLCFDKTNKLQKSKQRGISKCNTLT